MTASGRPASPPAPPLWRRPALVSLVVIQAVVGSGFALLIPALPLYVETLGGGATELGLFNSSYALALFVMAPLWGMLSDRIGRKPTLIAGVLGLGVSYVGLAIAPSLPVAIALRALGGAFAAATIPSSYAYVADTTTPEERGRAMGFVSAGLGVSFIFSPVIGGTLAALGLVMPFLLAAASAGVGAMLAVRFLRPAPPGGQPAPTARLGEDRGASLTPLLPVLSISFLVGLAEASRPTALALYADQELGFGSPELGVIFSVMGTCFVLTQPVVGLTITRFGERRAILVGITISSVGFLLALLPRDLLFLSLAVGLQGVGMAFCFTAIPSYISRVAQGGQGVAMGWRSTTQSGGYIAGPLIGGGLFSLAAPLPFFAGAAILGGALAFAPVALRQPREPAAVAAKVAVSPGAIAEEGMPWRG